jgi:hypothetical protein
MEKTAFEPLLKSPLCPPFSVVLGTVTGREHRRLGRNNQDAVAVAHADGLLVVALADGCSAGARSEVGAELSVRWVTERLPALYEASGRRLGPELVERVCDGLTGFLGVMAALSGVEHDHGGAPPPLRQIADLLLATLLVAAVDKASAVIFGVGDGVAFVNGVRRSPAEAPERAPAYLAYRLLGAGAFESEASPDCAPRLHWAGPAQDLHSVVLGTDGVHDLLRAEGHPLPDGSTWRGLEELLADPHLLTNRSLVQKRLRVLGDLPGLLPDDTTLALLRRSAPSAKEA